MSKSDSKIIYPNSEEEGGNVSLEFESCESIILLQLCNMQEGDYVIIETYTGDDCEHKWIPFNVDCCNQVRVDYPKNHLLLPLPLRYRAILLNVDDNHINDPSYFEDVEIFKTNIKPEHCVESMYHNCCSGSINVICDN